MMAEHHFFWDCFWGISIKGLLATFHRVSSKTMFPPWEQIIIDLFGNKYRLK